MARDGSTSSSSNERQDAAEGCTHSSEKRGNYRDYGTDRTTEMNEIGVTGFGFGSTKDTTGIQTRGYGYFMRQFFFIDTNMRIVYQQSGGQRG